MSRILRNESGAGAVGCLLNLVVAAAFLFVCYKVIPIYYHSSEFQTTAEIEVERAGAKSLGDDALRKAILNAARINEIPLQEKDIQIARITNQLAVDVSYAIKADFGVYSRVFSFHFRAKSVIGSL